MDRLAHPCGRSFARWAAALAAAALLSGCTTVHLVSDYDDQIDSGLTQLSTDTTAFVGRMVTAAGTPQGAYDANRDFYTNEDAKIDTLIVRAEAHKALNSCPSTAVVGKALQAASPTMAAAKYLDQIPKDDCEVVLLTLIRRGFDDLETFHRVQGPRGIPPSARDIILTGGLGALLRAGITIEVAKKNAQAAGGK